MKTLYTLLIAVLVLAESQAQDRSRTTNDRSHNGLVLISRPGNSDRQFRSLNRLNYWSSRFDRYWSKYERVLSRDFGPSILRSTRNLSTGRNDWTGDRYSTQNRKEVERKDGLIKIN